MSNLQINLKKKILERQTGASPETNLGIAWNVFAVTFPLFINLKTICNANTKWSKCMSEMQVGQHCE